MASKIKVDTLETANGSGTIALSNQLSGMTGASMPSGSVLQVVNATTTTEVSNSTASPPTRCVGLSGDIRSGLSASRFLSSEMRRSYSTSEISGHASL